MKLFEIPLVISVLFFIEKTKKQYKNDFKPT